jgi:hypothetical protein
MPSLFKKFSEPAQAENPAPKPEAGEEAAAAEMPANSQPFRTAWRGMLQKQLENPPAPDISALNGQAVQAAQFANAETAKQALAQMAVPPELMAGQAAGLLAQTAAAYLDGAAKLAMAGKAVLAKKMTEDIAAKQMDSAKDDALGIFLMDMAVGSASAFAVAAGAMDPDAVQAAQKQVDSSIEKLLGLIKAA